ncbi:tRNA (adenosine(37)-N6)-dimethylallyltransferase MiaA [Candidatus Parcubacteria bacterium]|nr:tRNA (adenosine(37)-N6)-dimethylallyltransferase MiaA [Candidatus Parcubacteria bacterium]
MQQNRNDKLIVILGPTASGKTELAIKLAKKFSGEIVSADSRQIYKRMDIGTGKATKKQMKIVPHHLIDIVNPDQEFNVTIYKKMAVKAIKDIQKKGKIPFLVGGTGLYIKAVVDNIEFLKIKPQKKLRKELENKTTEQLFKIYKKLDLRGAKLIDKQNKRRLIRAIEVCKATKKPFWEQRKKGNPLFDVLQIGIKIEKEKLKNKIENRIGKMFKQGLEKEVKNLSEKYGWKTWSMQTIGYQEWKPYFNKKITKKELQQIIALHTRQFAKRQMTWFKSDSRINWIKNEKQAEKLIKKFIKLTFPLNS